MPDRDNAAAGGANPPKPAGPSTHRFQERRQERMRGAGTHTAIQNDFHFTLPPPRNPTTTATTPTRATRVQQQQQPHAGPSSSPSSSSSARGAPSSVGGTTRSRARKPAAAAAAAAATGTGEDSLDTAVSPRHRASASVSTSRRTHRPPTSSTPAASRILRTAPSHRSTTHAASRARNRNRHRSPADGAADELGSHASSSSSDVDDPGSSLSPLPLDSPPAGGVGGSDPIDIQPDLSLPAIPSPPSSGSRLDASVGRNTAVSQRAPLGSSLVQLSADETVVSQDGNEADVDVDVDVDAQPTDSPAAKAAQRGQEARKRTRQASLGVDTLRRPPPAGPSLSAAGPKRIQTATATATAAAAKAKAKDKDKGKGKAPARVLFEEPIDASSDLEADATLQEIQRGRAPRPSTSASTAPRTADDRASRPTFPPHKPLTKPQQKEFHRRLRRALSLVLPRTSASASGATAADPTARPASTRKSRSLLNDIDILWTTLDAELKHAILAQPGKAVVSALKALRRGVRTRCTELSHRTDRRTHAILDLVRARRRKRELRRLVFETRREVYRSEAEEAERRDQIRRWKQQNEDVEKVQTFLTDVRTCAKAWT